MLPLTTIDPLTVAWIGAIFLLFGEVGALYSMPRLPRVIVVSTIAEIGYVDETIGFSASSAMNAAMILSRSRLAVSVASLDTTCTPSGW